MLRDGVVVVPLHAGGAGGSDSVDTGAGRRATPHQITQTEQRVVRLRQDGLEGRQVRMHIRNDEDSHRRHQARMAELYRTSRGVARIPPITPSASQWASRAL
jgi:hypothetical protein